MFREFEFVLTFLRKFISENELIVKYQALIDHVRAGQNSIGEEAKAVENKIQEIISDIISIHGNINWLLWTPPQLALLEKTKANQVIGDSAIARINSAFQGNTGNINGIISTLDELLKDTNELNTRIDQLFANLDIQNYEVDANSENGLIEIIFSENSKLINFWESQDRSKTWSLIIRSIAELTGDDYKKVKIVSWNSASPTLGIWLEGAKKFIEAFNLFAQFAVLLKEIKDKLLEKKSEAEKLDLDKSVLKIVREDLDRKFAGIYEEKKRKLTIELRDNYGKESTRSGNDGNNFIGIALEKAVEQLYEGARVVNPNEIVPKMSESNDDLVENAQSLGGLYLNNKKLEKKIASYIDAEVEKRLVERTKEMDRYLGSEIEPSLKWTKHEITQYLKKLGINPTGNKKDLLDKYYEYKEKLSEEIEKDSEAVDLNKEVETVTSDQST